MSERRPSRPKKSSAELNSIERLLGKSLNAELTEHDRMELKAKMEVIEKAINLLRTQALSELSDEVGPENILSLWAKQKHYQELILEFKIIARVI